MPDQLRVNGPPVVNIKVVGDRLYCWVRDPFGQVLAQGEVAASWIDAKTTEIHFVTVWAEGLALIDPTKRPVVDNPQA